MAEVLNDGNEYEKQLYHIYDLFNKRFFDSKLPAVQITFVPTKGAYGHMTTKQVWTSGNGPDSEKRYELNISSYTINRPLQEVCETVLHEQCHLYDIINYPPDEPDCSNGGRYHNKIFKQTAESHGLTCKKDGYYGWSETHFNAEGLAYFKRLALKPFNLKREPDPKHTPSLATLICPKCRQTMAYVTNARAYCHHLKCSVCDEYLVLREQ